MIAPPAITPRVLASLAGLPVALAITLLGAGPALGSEAPRASERPHGGEPYERAVFENQHVRVTELFAWPGAARALHARPAGVVVSLSKSRFEVAASGGPPSIVDYRPGEVFWVEEPRRLAWRLLAGEAHLFFIEVKSANGGPRPGSAPVKADHSTLVDPDQHHLVLENDHVRVIDGMASAGAHSARHSHPPSVLVSLAKSRFKVTIDGRTRIFDFEPAAVRWTNHFEHTWKILSGDARVIMVEIKSAEAAPEFRHRR